MARSFLDRRDAGRALARKLLPYRGDPTAVILALPRGGVPVGFEVAQALDLPLDILVVRKLGLPAQPELAMGAVASGGAVVLNDDILRLLPAASDTLERVKAREMLELVRREQAYRGDRESLDVRGRTCIVVDDGLATGATMAAALRAMKAAGAGRVVAAVPVASSEALARVTAIADEAACVLVPRWFSAVGQWYERFDQTDDDEVRELLSRAAALAAERGSRGNLPS